MLLAARFITTYLRMFLDRTGYHRREPERFGLAQLSGPLDVCETNDFRSINYISDIFTVEKEAGDSSGFQQVIGRARTIGS